MPHNVPDISSPARQPQALPRAVQEHLARKLRATFLEMQEKPAFLGDPALPAMFEEQLYRLRAEECARERRRAHRHGIAAVAVALAAMPDVSNPIR